MSEEKKLILKMLKEGKITEDEAIQLLDSIKDKKVDTDKYAQFEANFINKIVSAVDKIGKKSQEVINSIDIDDFTMGFNVNTNLKSKADRIYSENILGIENPKLKVENQNGKISILSWDNEEVEARAKVSYDEKLISPNYDFLNLVREDDTIFITPNYKETNLKHFELNMVIMVPKKIYDEIVVSTTNSSIDIEEIEAKHLEVSSANAKINMLNIVAENAVVKTTNAKIQIQNISGENLNIDTTNGKIELAELGSKIVDLATTNGALLLNKLSAEVKAIKASTYNGSISISLDGIFKPVKAKIGNANKANNNLNLSNKIFTNFVNAEGDQIAYSDGYDEEQENLYVEASTFNGTISIN